MIIQMPTLRDQQASKYVLSGAITKEQVVTGNHNRWKLVMHS